MYSLDFRKKVLSIRNEERLSIRDISKRFRLSRDTVFRWTKKIEVTVKRNRPAIKIDMEALKRDVEQYPDAYIYERAKRFGVSSSGMRKALIRLGITYKKNAKTSQSRSRKKIYVLPAD